jgi:sigma-B regulation protein RsbU (phosphoserine phosphatase)
MTPSTLLAPRGHGGFVRDWLDQATLHNFAKGLAGTLSLPALIHDADGVLLAAASAEGRGQAGSQAVPPTLPLPLSFERVEPVETPERLAFFEDGGLRYTVAPVRPHRRPAGYVTIAERTDERKPHPARTAEGNEAETTATRSVAVAADVRGDTPVIRALRWAARLLADLCTGEQRIQSLADEFALLGDIGALLSGEGNLQALLDRIVRETSRVMKCRYSSLRLYEADTDELRIAAAYNLSQRYADRGVILRSENKIDDEALKGKLVYIEDAQTDMRIPFRDEVASLRIRSGLTAGLIYRGRPVGVLRVYADRLRRFSRLQRQLLRAIASQAATAIVNARLFEEHMHAVELERQLALAGSVQSRMIRAAPAHPRGIDTAMIFAPSSHVSGDFCDILTLPDRRLAAAVGDVVGHGVPAALLMASIRGALRAIAESCSDLGEILARLNRHIARETTAGEFATVLIIAVDPATRNMRYVNAGHDPLLLLRGEEVFQPEETNLVLGLDPDERFGVHDLDLKPGDFVLLYTDGTVEAMNFEGELFGRRRLLKLVRRYGVQHPDQALRNIHWDIRRFVGLAEQSDDLTLVGLRIGDDTQTD